MPKWSQNPVWSPTTNINQGNQYSASDGVTVTDMNSIINNMIYLKKYGGRVNVLKVDATVSGNKLILKSEEV